MVITAAIAPMVREQSADQRRAEPTTPQSGWKGIPDGAMDYVPRARCIRKLGPGADGDVLSHAR